MPPELPQTPALPPPGTDGYLFLVDLSGYIFRAYHAIAPLSNSKGEVTHAVMGTVNMLQKVVNERRPHRLAVAMDSRKASFRKELDPRYKANRPPPPADLSSQIERCRQIVEAYNIPIFQVDGLEADDLIAVAVDRALADGLSVVVVSSDKDLMQLVHDDDARVVLWDSMRDKVYGPREVEAKFGVPPSKLRDLLALTGDSSDNVPGVPSVGPKTAADLLAQFGDLDGIYARLGEVKRPKLQAALRDHEADARLSRTLVTLKRDAPLAWDLAHLVYGGANHVELRRLFGELEFTRLRDLVDQDEKRASADLARTVAVTGESPETTSARVAATEAQTKRINETVLTRERLDAMVARAKETGLLAIEVQTTNPEAMRAEILGVSLSVAAGEGAYVPLAHRYLGAPPQLRWEEVRDALRPAIDDPTITKAAHPWKFTALVLGRFGLPMPVDGAMFDTQLASYLLDPEGNSTLKELARRELGVTLLTYDEATSKQRGSQLPFDQVEVERATEFAAAGAAACFELTERLGPRMEKEGLRSLVIDVELPLARVLADMEGIGVKVDVAKLHEVNQRVEARLKTLDAEAKAVAQKDFSLRSRDQLEKVLFDDLGLPVLKRTPKGGRSTDAAVLEELAEMHELPRLVCDYRELDKLKGTYLDALPRAVNPQTGRIHTTYNQTNAATGRIASSDPNLQNIPIRTDVGREIREAFVAEKGNVIVSADYSQIELRVLAHLARDAQLLDAFKSGEDVHVRTSSLIFNVPRDQVTVDMRRRAKTINFGVIYGMGDSALAKQLGIERSEAARFIAAYFERYEGVARFMESTVEKARSGEAVRTLLGRRRFLPNLHSSNRGLRAEAERIAKNTPIQGTAADILKVAMVNLGKGDVVPGARMLLTVHDELVFEVPEEKVTEATGAIREAMGAMSGALALDVPLLVEVGHGPNWRVAHA
jgi:DNA polymerase-1